LKIIKNYEKFIENKDPNALEKRIKAKFSRSLGNLGVKKN
jgi:hypothetical protein